MPDESNKDLFFKNQHYQHKLPYTIYADFESIILPLDTVQNSTQNSFSSKISKHEACGYAYVIVGPNGQSYKPVTCYRGENAVEHFLNAIICEKNELAKILYTNIPICMTPQDKYDFEHETHCFICKKELGKDRVADHDHLSGRYRGALHNFCNLRFRLTKTITVVFHNLRHYDSHLIMSTLGKIKDHDVSVIATNMEKYISFSVTSFYEKCKVELRFIDSFQFLSTSLEKLVSNLSPSDFKILNENIPQHTDLLLRKGIYPYEYMSNYEKFNETQLPSKDCFFSSLTEEHITDEEYEHAHAVWKAFQLQNIGQYHDLYVKTDVLQLADVFENFRLICLKKYEIDCAHLYTSAGLAWQACLKMCDQPLELITDPNMHLMIENGIRGGISMITHRFARANNKYLKNSYDPSKPSSYLIYLDANNLYGWAMSQSLPIGNFEWVSTHGIDTDWILSLPDDGDVGYVFEVDLEYPDHLHDKHNEYPLAPEKMEIRKEMWSPHSANLAQNCTYSKSTKLTPNLNNKKRYVTHYRNLKFYLQEGLKLTHIHSILKFNQKPWLKQYIEFNTEQRKNVKSTFEKNLYKLMNNAVYGKTMENVRKHKDIQLVNTSSKSEKLIAAPSFRAFSIFDNSLVGVERCQRTIFLNKPLYVGFAILELSKLHMYNFHYNYIKKRYGSESRLLFTDTDSLAYEIQTDDIYEDMKCDIDNFFDTSDYPTDHLLYSEKNKKRIGFFKDETNSIPIHEFVGLRSKMYSILTESFEKKTAKGISRTFIKHKLNHNNYKQCLLNSTKSRGVQSRIQSIKHELYSVNINKITLSSFDDKRYLLDDGVESLAYGHYKINDL